MLITIARYSTALEAHIAKGKIEWAGFPAFVADEHTVTVNWLYSNALGGVRILVPDEAAQEAQKILQEDWGNSLIQELGYDGVPCPICESDDTEFYLFGRRLNCACILFFNFMLFPLRDGVKCNNCGKKSKHSS